MCSGLIKLSITFRKLRLCAIARLRLRLRFVLGVFEV